MNKLQKAAIALREAADALQALPIKKVELYTTLFGTPPAITPERLREHAVWCEQQEAMYKKALDDE